MVKRKWTNNQINFQSFCSFFCIKPNLFEKIGVNGLNFKTLIKSNKIYHNRLDLEFNFLEEAMI